MFQKSLLLAAGVAVGAFAPPAIAATEIQFWHALGGTLGEELQAIAEEFNASQTDWKVNAVYKGNYTETMTAAIAAFRAKQATHIVQVFEVGRSEEHTSELQSLMRISYAVFCLKKKKKNKNNT